MLAFLRRRPDVLGRPLESTTPLPAVLTSAAILGNRGLTCGWVAFWIAPAYPPGALPRAERPDHPTAAGPRYAVAAPAAAEDAGRSSVAARISSTGRPLARRTLSEVEPARA